MSIVGFKNIGIDRESEQLHEFIFECGSWNKYVFRKHPKLKMALKLRGKKERLAFIREYAETFWQKNKKTIESQRQSYQDGWRQIEADVFAGLENIIETKFPKNRKISAYISINPICPRFLDEWAFTMFYKFSPRRAKEIILHECCHFLYFKKWKELFSGAKEKTFDSPHIIWHLSELAAPIILNDPRLQKYLKSKAGFYEEHEEVRIGAKSAPEFFADIYKNSGNFEEFARKALTVINKHKKLFFLY